MMKRLMKFAAPFFILIIGFLAMQVLLSFRSESPKRPPEIRSKIVETEVVHLHPITTEIVAYGRAASGQPVHLYAEAAGGLEEGDIPFKPGQKFSKGDLLIRIDDRQTRLDLYSAKSDLMTALATVLPEIKVNFADQYPPWQAYFDALDFESRITPLPETDNPRIKLFLSRFNVYKLFFTVRDLEILLEKHNIFAPFDGSIVSAELRTGSTARIGSLLGEIINLEQMEVTIPLEAGNVPLIDRDKAVKLTSSEISGQWSGRIVRVGSAIDIRTQTVIIYIAVENGRAASLLNGVFLEARIPAKILGAAFPVPPKAMYEDRYVYIIDDGKLVRRDINILRRETDRVIVNGGIKDGDILVVELMQGVVEGMPAQSKTDVEASRGL